MDVRIPPGFDPVVLEALKAEERARSQALQTVGKWRHIWRIAGRYANVSIFDVSGHDELHDIVSSLPLFPFMDVEVLPLAQHPSAIERGDGAVP